MKLFRKIIICALTLALACTGYFEYVRLCLPDSVSVYAGGDFNFASGLLTLREHSYDAKQVAGMLGESREASLALFGMIPLKTVRVTTAQRQYLVPSGIPFGVKMFTDGAVVVGLTDVRTEKGTVCPAREAGIRSGDIVTDIDGKRITGNDALSSIVASSEGGVLKISYTRDGEKLQSALYPARSRDGGWKAGMWVRDSTAGIGTLTYINESTGIAAGLGHGVTDRDSGVVMPLASGELTRVEITDVVRGQSGSAGELRGVFGSGAPFARLLHNCEFGVYAEVLKQPSSLPALPTALRQEIKIGPALMLCTVDARGPRYYDIDILSISLSDVYAQKNLVIRVTDDELIRATGGIVQGLSGSPIVQNGCIIGAVTHVFVSDPTRGYGIFIENMLECEKTAARALSDAA